MIWLRRHRTAARAAIVVATVLLCWGALVIGTGDRFGRLAIGTPSPSDFDATETVTVVDQDATDERIQAAQRDVSNVYEVIPGVDSEVTDGITALFEAARQGIGPGPGVTIDHHNARPCHHGDDGARYNRDHGAPPGGSRYVCPQDDDAPPPLPPPS